jgi:type I restriction enzyme S subunit
MQSKMPITSVAKVISGYAFKSSEFSDQGVPVIKIKNIRTGNIDFSDTDYVSDQYLSLDSKYHVRSEDILISLTGSHVNQPNSVVGRVARYPRGLGIALLNQRAGKVIIRDPDRCDKSFLYYHLFDERTRREIAALAHGAANQANISPSQIESIKINLPSHANQKKIGVVLSAYDDLIENNLRRIKILEETAQTLYREWFVKFRFPGHQKVKMVNSPLGKIPGGWEIKNLFELAEVTYGFPFKSSLFNVNREGKPVVRIRDVLDGQSATFTTEDALDKYIVEDGDFLVGMDGDFHMGFWAGGTAFLVQRVARFRPRREVGRYGLALALKGPIEHFNKTITGTTVAHLGDNHLRTINMMMPDKKLLKVINDILDPLLDLQLNIRAKNKNLRQTRDLLLPKLISGEVDVSELDITIPEANA